MKKVYIIVISLIFLIFSSPQLSAQVQRHIVKDGETLEYIAQKYGVKVKDLKKLNPSANSSLVSGMVLFIPGNDSGKIVRHGSYQQTGGTNYNRGSVNGGVFCRHYAEAGYTWSHLANSGGGFDRNFNIGDFGYHIVFNFFTALPDFKLETGLNFAFGSSKNVQYNVLDKPLHVDYNTMYLTMPVLMSYEVSLNNGTMILPKAGLYARYYLSASSNDYSDDPDVKRAFRDLGMEFGETDLLKDRYSKWNQFGFGIQVGADAIFMDHIIFGVTYIHQFTDTMPYYKFSHSVNVKLGWVF